MKLHMEIKPVAEMALGQFREAYPDARGVTAMVVLFRAEHAGKKFYCAQCGGGSSFEGPLDRQNFGLQWLDDKAVNQFWFTPHGHAAALTLTEWYNQVGPEDRHMVMKELVRGPTPMVEKLRDTFDLAPDGAAVCFVGDFAKKLDGAIAKLLLRSAQEGEI